ncbi:MAG: sigma-70 family RNA polymerase sigma factor [Roseiflexus sp.]|jgi:RNA polymerase sigma-70 factor (ECF subfamily)|nr:sigma-70 family RNA polymerase sigma factor [Roseiflexus sp.]MBO9365145.1 sigma-70 family RNA polymerase sigma factor [Roseiflexus sp.]MBO9383133.1 sigma-70 family RNA polymerase sigma factor [Roseiflexus sp.]MBO9390275.1 sigma-70 family RNA polymerase sigma factor [Roseiflexus sp.]
MVADTNAELPSLIARAQAGDAAAFGELYTRYAKFILRYMYVRTREPELAQDLTQEVFIRVIKGIGGLQYRGEKLFLGWLYTIAGNVLVGQARRRQIAASSLDDTAEVTDPHGQDAVASLFERLSLQHAIAQLTVEQQHVLMMKFFGDMTNQEIAATIGKTEGAVKALQHRAIQALQQILEQESGEQLMSKALGSADIA